MYWSATKLTWCTVRCLSGKESHTTEKSLLYKGSVYITDSAKASAFVQEYEKISGLRSDKDSRKADIDPDDLHDPHTSP